MKSQDPLLTLTDFQCWNSWPILFTLRLQRLAELWSHYIAVRSSLLCISCSHLVSRIAAWLKSCALGPAVHMEGVLMKHSGRVLRQGAKVFTLTLVFSTIAVPMFFADEREKQQSTAGELRRFEGRKRGGARLAVFPRGRAAVKGGGGGRLRVW